MTVKTLTLSGIKKVLNAENLCVSGNFPLSPYSALAASCLFDRFVFLSVLS